jgi:glycolate dehydrogenase FAD-binding subunit
MTGTARIGAEVTDRDAILGVRPRAVYAPATVDECAEVMTMAARERLRLGFVGGGTSLGHGAAPTALDAVVRTERLARIIEHVPADMVVVAEAGVTLAALQAALGAHGQRLALDAPSPERATIGGLIASGGFGPLRARYGGVRDLIIGVTLVRADGEVARGGGKVVKNVAGFDLPKVACGSLGTLGLVAAAAFRLHPLPEATRTVWAGGLRAEAVVALVAAARDAQLEPASVVAVTQAPRGIDRRSRIAGGGDPDGSAGGAGDLPRGPDRRSRIAGGGDPDGSAGGAGDLPRGIDRFELGFRFEGFGRGVEHQASQMIARAHAAGARAEQLDDAAAAAFWRRHDQVRTAAPLRLRVAGLPTRLASIAALVALLGDFTWYATLGLGFAGGAMHDLATTVAAVTAARAALVAEGGSLVLEEAPPQLRAAIDPWGPVPPAFSIMERLKRRFDPEGRLNPGRFVGGL